MPSAFSTRTFARLAAGVFVAGLFVGCSPAKSHVTLPVPSARTGPERLPLRYDHHVPSVAARIDGWLDTRLVVDTGIGINVVSKSLCKMLSCTNAGHYVGLRMSGQELTIPLAKIQSLAIGHEEQRDVVVGVIDMDGFVDAPDIQGFVSLGFFARHPFTLDETRAELVLEDASSVDARLRAGTTVSVKLRREGESLTAFLPLDVGGQAVLAEIDTGSDALILDERFMSPLGIDKSATKTVTGQDETGHPFIRWFTVLDKVVATAEATAIRQDSARTMFQKIIHDGLVGRLFFRPWVVTFDLPHERLVFAKAEPERSFNAPK